MNLVPPIDEVLLSDARVLAAYLIFAGSYFVFALGKPKTWTSGSRLFPIGLPVTIATLAVGSAWLWLGAS